MPRIESRPGQMPCHCAVKSGLVLQNQSISFFLSLGPYFPLSFPLTLHFHFYSLSFIHSFSTHPLIHASSLFLSLLHHFPQLSCHSINHSLFSFLPPHFPSAQTPPLSLLSPNPPLCLCGWPALCWLGELIHLAQPAVLRDVFSCFLRCLKVI